MLEYDEDTVADLISRIQVYCYPRRIRMKEFFKDFDHLRCIKLRLLRYLDLRHGRCTIINFARALDTPLALRFLLLYVSRLGMQGLTDEEVDVMAEHFTEHGAHVAPPQALEF